MCRWAPGDQGLVEQGREHYHWGLVKESTNLQLRSMKSLRNVPVVLAYYAGTVARSTQEVREKYALQIRHSVQLSVK